MGWFVWAMCCAYRHSDISLVLWVFIYIVIAIYFRTVIVSVRRKSGFQKFIAHILTMQVVPLCVAILISAALPEEAAPLLKPKIEIEAESATASFEPLIGRPRDYERSFNDMQEKQKAAALKNGLSTFESQAEIERNYNNLLAGGKLVHIATNPRYVVRELTYSAPYVVPKMSKLLDDIAKSVQQKTESNVRFVVTSVLRTEDDIKKLKRVNGNASADSCHCNATTVDISYVRFDKDGEEMKDVYQFRLALAQTLHELRKEGRCYVKFEKKQYCYHITVR